MKQSNIPIRFLILAVEIIFFISGCKSELPQDIHHINREPVIEPDYTGVTIPQNIAPMNFIITEEGESFILRITSSNGTLLTLNSRNNVIHFPPGSWKKLLATGALGENRN